MKERRWEVLLAGALLLAAVLAVLGGLARLSRPNPALENVPLNYTAADTHGWAFETEEGPAEPVLSQLGFLTGIPMDTAGPIAATRTMEDTGELNLLQFSYYNVGIQVFLDGKLLYTDFPDRENRPEVFLTEVDTEDLSQELLFVSLPADCAGQELRVVTYGPSWDGYRQPVVPVLASRFSDAVTLVADVVRYLAAGTALALLALFLLLMFLLGVSDGRRQWNLLPLAAYFLLTAVRVTLSSYLSTAAGLNDAQPLLHWIRLGYMDFLMVFLAIELRDWKRWLLLAGSAVHALLSLVWVIWGVPSVFFSVETSPVGLALLVLAAVLLALSRREKAIFRWVLAGFCLTAGVLFAAWAVSRFVGLSLLYPLANPVTSLLMGNPRGFYTTLCAVASVFSAAWVTGQFAQDALERRKREQALRANNRLIEESYHTAEDKLRQNALMRHEWKNEIAVLHLFQQQGDLAGLGGYLDELDDRLDKLTPRQYTEHFAINTILQNAAARAETLDVKFKASAMVPPELNIDTGDLCGLLLNMLDNALDAAAWCPPPTAREVECVLKVRQGYLAVKCENTYASPLLLDEHGRFLTTKADRDAHGFGMAKMQAVAEKYGSALDINYTSERFTVQTALKIR